MDQHLDDRARTSVTDSGLLGSKSGLSLPRSIKAHGLNGTVRLAEIPHLHRHVVSGTGQPFQRGIVKHIRRGHHLRSLYERLRARELLTRDEMADRLNVSGDTVKICGRHGLLPHHRCNDKGECLYEPPSPNAPIKMQGRHLSDRQRRDVLSDQTNEVQYEA